MRQTTNFSLLFIALISTIACDTISFPAVIGVLGEIVDSTSDPVTYTVNSEIVRWIENSGGVVYVINPFLNDADLSKKLMQFDGFVLNGKKGQVFDSTFTTPFKIVQAVKSLYDGDLKVKIPLFASGSAFRALFIGDVSDKDVPLDSETQLINGDAERLRSSKLFDYLSDDDLASYMQGGEVFFNEKTLTSIEAFNRLPGRNDIRITSLINIDGVNYINSAEFYGPDIYGTQFRPESIGFDRNINLLPPVDNISFTISRGIGNFIVSEALKVNRNYGFDTTDENLLNPHTTTYKFRNNEYFKDFTTPKPQPNQN